MSSAREIQRAAEWNRANPERRREINKKYRETHREELVQKQKTYYQRWKLKKLNQNQTLAV